ASPAPTPGTGGGCPFFERRHGDRFCAGGVRPDPSTVPLREGRDPRPLLSGTLTFHWGRRVPGFRPPFAGCCAHTRNTAEVRLGLFGARQRRPSSQRREGERRTRIARLGGAVLAGDWLGRARSNPRSFRGVATRTRGLWAGLRRRGSRARRVQGPRRTTPLCR